MSTYHETAQTEKTNLLTVEALRRWRPGKLIKACLRCGRRFIRTGRAFRVYCVEGRVEIVRVCRACAAATAFAAAISSPEVQAA